MSYCKVQGCRFPATHTTKYHCCGICKKLGHGQVECGNDSNIKQLGKDTSIIPFELQCTVIGCQSITTHITDGHKCPYCHTFGHDVLDCPIKKWDYKVECGTTFGQSKSMYLEKKNIILQAKKQFGWKDQHMTYTKIYGGLGSIWYAKRKNIFDKIELFFMHSDNWGQYGSSTDDRPKLNKFLEGYQSIDKE